MIEARAALRVNFRQEEAVIFAELDRFAIGCREKRENHEDTKNTKREEEPRFLLSSFFVLFVSSWFLLFSSRTSE